MCVYIYIYIYICIYTHIHIYTYMCVYVCMYVCVCIYIYIYVHIHICMYMYIYIYIHMYVYTHVHTTTVSQHDADCPCLEMSTAVFKAVAGNDRHCSQGVSIHMIDQAGRAWLPGCLAAWLPAVAVLSLDGSELRLCALVARTSSYMVSSCCLTVAHRARNRSAAHSTRSGRAFVLRTPYSSGMVRVYPPTMGVCFRFGVCFERFQDVVFSGGTKHTLMSTCTDE